MSLSDYLLFLPMCFALNLAFGPNNLLSVTYGARHGVRAAVTAGTGRLAAFAIMIAISGLGVGSLLLASEQAFAVVKLVGAAYLIWLGVRLLRAPAPVAASALRGTDGPAPALGRLVRQEFLVAIGNPKAILIFTAFLPQFTVPQAYAESYAEVALTFLLLEWIAVVIYAVLGRRMARIAAGPRTMHWFNRASGSLMVGFGMLLALARRPQA